MRFPAPVEGLATFFSVLRVRQRSAEAADVRKRDEQAEAICSVCEESMGDEIDYVYTETDPISLGELAHGRDEEINKMLTSLVSLPQDAPHRDQPVITLVPQDESSSDPISATWVDKRGPDGKAKCALRCTAFQEMCPA